MTAAQDEEGWLALDGRARLLFYLQSLSSFLLVEAPVSLAVGGLAAWMISPALGLVVGALLMLVQGVAALWMPTLAFDRWRYLLREEDLLIAHGVFVRRVVAIPMSRVQHVDARQGVIEQWMGLARVQVYTASGGGADGTVPGLDIDVAERLRDELVARGGGEDGL